MRSQMSTGHVESWLANLSELSNFTVSRCLKSVDFG